MDRAAEVNREEPSVVQEIDCASGDWCSCERRMSSVRCLRGNVEAEDSQRSSTERWVEAGTRCNGGHILRTIPCSTHSFGNVHVGWFDRLFVACRIPGAIPSDGLAGSDGQDRGASGSVRHRWRRIRWYRLVAKRSTLLQGGQRVCDSESSPGGQTGTAPVRIFVYLSVDLIVIELACAPKRGDVCHVCQRRSPTFRSW
jgi:hypothetical protein